MDHSQPVQYSSNPPPYDRANSILSRFPEDQVMINHSSEVYRVLYCYTSKNHVVVKKEDQLAYMCHISRFLLHRCLYYLEGNREIIVVRSYKVPFVILIATRTHADEAVRYLLSKKKDTIAYKIKGWFGQR